MVEGPSMARGRTKSKLSRSERLEEAFSLFRRGATNAEVARALKVHADTAASYRRKYEERLTQQAAEHPEMLTKVLENTFRLIEEIDAIRQEVWRALKPKKEYHTFECEHCSETNDVVLRTEVGGQTKSALLNTLLKATDQRMKAFGLTGVKQEVFVAFQQVDLVQRALLEFMGRELCAADREKLAVFIETRFPSYSQAPGLPEAPPDQLAGEPIDVESRVST